MDALSHFNIFCNTQHAVLSSWLWIQSKTIIDQVEREKRELLCCKPFDFIQINFYLSKLKAKTISFIEVEEKFVNILKIKLNCVNFCSHNINFVRLSNQNETYNLFGFKANSNYTNIIQTMLIVITAPLDAKQTNIS